MKDESDPIKPWFYAAEALGEYIGIRFGRIKPGETEPEWIFLRHTEFDGIGGLAEILRQRGADLKNLPQIKHPANPSWVSTVKLLPKLLRPQRRIDWAPMERGPSVQSSAQPPPAVAWHVFGEPVTSQIRRLCRKTRVTVNSLLLKNLSKAIRPFLKDHAAVVPWMIPVNLRGKVNRDSDVENHSSYIGVRIKSYETTRDVHKRIYAALERGEHWSNWSGYALGKVLPASVRKHLVKTGRCMSQWNLGGFSNLGDWDSGHEISAAPCQGSWLFSPPVLRCQFVGAGCVTFQNRLSLTIQAHPDLTTDPSVPRAWMQHWLKEIEFDVSSVLAEPVAISVIAA